MSRKLRIAFVLGPFPVVSETFIVNQITSMIERGHNVLIFSSHKMDAPYHQPVIDYSLMRKTTFSCELNKTQLIGKIINLMFSSVRIFFRLPFYLIHLKFIQKKSIPSSFLFLVDFLLNNEIDVVHAHFGTVALPLETIYSWGIMNDVKFVATFHGCDMHNVGVGVYKQLFLKGDLFTVNSEYSRKQLIKLGCNPGKIDKMPVGLDTSFFVKKQTNVSHGLFQLLFIGRLIELKAPDLLVEICFELKKKGLSFNCFIIGDGELKEKLQSKIKALGLEKEVFLLGSLTQQQVILEMQYVDVFVYPGIYDRTGRAETQGLVIQEAQSMELPAVVSNVGGAPEGVLDGETGFVVKEKDISGFVEKILLLHANPEMRRKMGFSAREWVVKNYDNMVLAEALEQKYLRLLNGN